VENLKQMLAGLKDQKAVYNKPGRAMGSGIAAATGLKKFGDEWEKAVRNKDVVALEKLHKSLDKFKDVSKAVNKLKTLNETLAQAEKGFKKAEKALDQKKMSAYAQKIRETSDEMSKLQKIAHESAEEFEDLNRSLVGKGFKELKDLAKSKWGAFASGTAAVGFFAQSLRSLDSASDFAKASMLNMPVSELAKDTKELTFHINESDNAFTRFAKNLYGTGEAYVDNIDRNKEAIKFQNQLSETVLVTGKSLGEMSETAKDVMARFNVTLQQNSKEILDTTKNAALLGTTLGIGTASTLDYFEKRVKTTGVSLKQAQRDLAYTSIAADELKNEFKDVSLTSRDLAKSTVNMSDADIRHSQNMRIKIQLMKNQVAESLRMGKTQEEALKDGEEAANVFANASDTVKMVANMDMSKTFESMVKGGKSFEDISKHFLKGIDDPKEKERLTKSLQSTFDLSKKGLLKGVSLGESLNEDFGSQEVGMKATFKAMQKLYTSGLGSGELGKILDTAGIKSQAVKKQWIEALDVAKKQGTDAGMDFLTKSKTMSDANTTTADAQLTSMEKVGKAMNSTSLTGVVDVVKSFIENPIVSAALGVISVGGLAAVAAANIANTAAVSANTAAILGKSVTDVAGGGLLSKIGGIGTKAGGALLAGKAFLGSSLGAIGSGTVAGMAGAGALVAGSGYLGYQAGDAVMNTGVGQKYLTGNFNGATVSDDEAFAQGKAKFEASRKKRRENGLGSPKTDVNGTSTFIERKPMDSNTYAPPTSSSSGSGGITQSSVDASGTPLSPGTPTGGLVATPMGLDAQGNLNLQITNFAAVTAAANRQNNGR